MGRAFVYVIVGGGVAAGYAAHEFVKRGVSQGELCIISEEPVAPYERPALSKGYLLPEAPARLPSFHCCVGTHEERLAPKWYKEHGIELILGTRVKSADVRRKTLLTATGETISYKYLIVATGARYMLLLLLCNFSHFLMYENVQVILELVVWLPWTKFNFDCIRPGQVDIIKRPKLVNVMQSCTGGNAVVIGGGYIGMECAASLVINKLNVTMVTAVNLRDGNKLPADMVVIGIGIRPNTSLFEGQLTMEKGGIKVNGKMQSSNSSVYAIGDVAAFPVKVVGETRRLEHVDSARKSARHAVAAIKEPEKTGEFDYLPFFYSRVFTLSWQFYGDNAGEVVHFGDFSGNTFGAYWIHKGQLVGSFLEGGTKEQYEAIAQATRLKPKVEDLTELERLGVEFALSVSEKAPSPRPTEVGGGSGVILEKPLYAWHAAAGVIVAASVAAFAYWYGRRRRRW
ncbi:Monodehydroascorbate reductase 4, peroxisomal [Sesamum angolense]|uniref:monodehydroascorbate reductase (NADH) n=1 Tax=Sesamum angolense TaxID=2727404 RepID=A0AAE1WGE8_9LAMI|nr:Monodehydroascorbate reductase 4, peroxisomal [Sesamum angolense]